MKLSIMNPIRPCTLIKPHSLLQQNQSFLPKPNPIHNNVKTRRRRTTNVSLGMRPSLQVQDMKNTNDNLLGHEWMDYQGISNWDGLLDPLDDTLREEIIRYGNFVDAAYKSYDFDPSSPTYARCLHSKGKLLPRSTGYQVSRHLRATSGIRAPEWMERAPGWMSTQSSWIGYVAVCHDKGEIARLGRRDVVIALRGTATCFEWMENLRATLTPLHPQDNYYNNNDCGPVMVESGFLSLYTSSTGNSQSLQTSIREEISRILKVYGGEPLSITISGHSLGAALAILAAYDIKKTFNGSPLVTVVSFGGPRVGNPSFRWHLEEQGTKVLRIVNSDDPITKVPGFVVDDVRVDSRRNWFRKLVEDTRWGYADVGCELRLSSRDSGGGINIAACHDLKTYLDLIGGFVSSNCPIRATAKKIIAGGRRVTKRMDQTAVAA